MARPERVLVQAGVAAWDSIVNDNTNKLFITPSPVPLHTGDETDLQATHPAASYDKCLIFVDHTVEGWVLYVSTGAAWIKYVS
ncbi:unnamed protein product, partial [marine sediment metagenome]